MAAMIGTQISTQTGTEAKAVDIPAIAEGRRPRVLVLGGGFAGLRAAKELSRLPVDITLVDKSNHNTFQPLLYQVALAVLSPANIATPIRTALRKYENIEVILDEATGFDLERRHVRMKDGSAIGYDYLVLATGSTHSYFGHEEWQSLAPGLKSIEDATEIRRRVLLAFELAERQALETGSHPPLNFVIVGGGPTGVELAGAIAEISKYFMSQDFRHIDPKLARIILVEGGKRILPSYPQDLTDKAIKQLNQLGVEVRAGEEVKDVQPGYVVVGNKNERIDTVVTLWGAGVAPSPLGKLLGVATDKKGCPLVNDTLNPEGHPEIFVCGDLAHFEQDGHRVPGVAQPALQMGAHAAKSIGEDLECRPRTPFRYFDKGDMATIGRYSAVADIKWPFKAHWGGLPAWITWLMVHLVFIIDFRSRVAVLAQWGWTYLFYSRGARLITGSLDLPGWNRLLEREEVAVEPPTKLRGPSTDPATSQELAPSTVTRS